MAGLEDAPGPTFDHRRDAGATLGLNGGYKSTRLARALRAGTALPIGQQNTQVGMVGIVVTVEVTGATVHGVVATPVGQEDAQIDLIGIAVPVKIADARRRGHDHLANPGPPG